MIDNRFENMKLGFTQGGVNPYNKMKIGQYKLVKLSPHDKIIFKTIAQDLVPVKSSAPKGKIDYIYKTQKK